MVRALLVLAALVAAASAMQDAPQAVRLAYAGEGAMSVSWNTDTRLPQQVEFGTSAANLSQAAAASTRNYTTVLFIHTATMSNLAPATTYYYRCGAKGTGQSPVFSFTSAPATGSHTPMTFAVFGDMGVSHSEATVAALTENVDGLTGVISVGDYSYADDRLFVKKQYEEVWDEFQAMLEPVTSRKPFMVLPGNHDASCHSFGQWWCPPNLDNFTAFNHRYSMPSAQSGGVENMWFSFDVGMAHVVFMDTETDLPGGGPEGADSIWHAGGYWKNQLDWLKADLAKATANRANTPWLIVAGHRPLYTSSSSGSENLVWPNATGKLRAAVEDMFMDAKVDMYLCGHVHAYERLWPVYHNVTISHSYDDHAVFLVVGSAGNIEGVSSWAHTVPDWLAFRSRDYGFGRLNLLTASNATWEYVRASDGSILDTISFSRSRQAVV